MAIQNDTAAQSGGAKKFILASVGVSLLGLLAGYSIAAVLLHPGKQLAAGNSDAVSESPVLENAHGPVDEKAADASENEIEAVARGPFRAVPLQPIVTNLSDSKEVWVRLEASMLFDSKSEADSELLAHKLSQHVLAYLRTLKLTDVQGVDAMNAITQDLNEIASTVSDGQAQGVLISSLVFE